MKNTDELIRVLNPQDVFKTLDAIDEHITTTILDPWYNRGVGGARDDYDQWLRDVVAKTARISDHIFVWGFPDIVCRVLTSLPEGVSLVAWLTWYYKNCPSVIRGWRSAQYTCLHLSHEKAPVYPEHFMNDTQLEKMKQGKMRFVPGPPTVLEVPLDIPTDIPNPPTVLEVPLNIGWVGKKEQTGHPAQKPEKVIEPLIRMTTKEGDTILDPMCGAGTTGIVCANLGRKAILSDIDGYWVNVTRWRNGLGGLYAEADMPLEEVN